MQFVHRMLNYLFVFLHWIILCCILCSYRLFLSECLDIFCLQPYHVGTLKLLACLLDVRRIKCSGYWLLFYVTVKGKPFFFSTV